MNTDVSPPTVVLPSVEFDLLLVVSWIIKAVLSLDTERRRLIHRSKEYTIDSMVIPLLPKEVFLLPYKFPSTVRCLCEEGEISPCAIQSGRPWGNG